jgi:hypothetical protein
MSAQLFDEILAEAQSDGTALNTSTTPTSILPTHARATIVPGILRTPGKTLHVWASGRASCMNPTPGNLTLDFRLGPTSNIVVFNGGTVALNTAVAKTNVTWWLEMLLTVRSVGGGTSATILGTGFLQSEVINGAAAGFAESASLPATAPAAGTGFDSTVSNVADLFATFSVSNAANSIQLHQYILALKN